MRKGFDQMDTTITISNKSAAHKSDFLQFTYNAGKNKDAVISVGSSKFVQNGSHSWDKKCSPLSNIEKVTNWMRQNDKECTNTTTDYNKNNESDPKSLILVRCDFNKTTNTQSYYHSTYNRSSSLIDYLKDEVVLKQNSHLEKDSSCRTESSHSSDKLEEIPTSPESRKKELCRYLQLMNPADKKEIIILQNRRSTRVKNLVEQKQVQEKIKEINQVSTLKSFKELNIQFDSKSDDSDHFTFPLPPRDLSPSDFDDVMKTIVPKLRRICREKKIPLLMRSRRQRAIEKMKSNAKLKNLRSNGKLINIPMERLIYNERRRSRLPKVVAKSKKPESANCEIISVGQEEDELDLDHIMDLADFDKLSEEHKKCLIESRIFSTSNDLLEYTKSKAKDIIQIHETYNTSTEQSDAAKETSISKYQEIDMQKQKEQILNGNTYLIVNIHTPNQPKRPDNVSDGSTGSEESTNSTVQDHDYIGKTITDSENSNEIIPDQSVNNSKFELLPYKPNEGTDTLHKSLRFHDTGRKQKHSLTSNCSMTQEWDLRSSPKQHSKKQSHFISIDPENGAVLKAYYMNYNLIVCQEFMVSFWMQTPLGNILGAQNMWIPRGQTQRITLNNRCLQKDSTEKVICLDNSIVYIELWMKEHKSEMRQGPVADVFVTLYYWQRRQNGLEKKVLQLENINGFADDVQYCVMNKYPKIVVSWHSANEETTQKKKTFIHAYQLALDYQTVSNIYNIEPVEHYVSSLHNIEDYDDLIMGCGENKITLWNIEFGHIIATIELNDIKTPLSTLWVKCDRGFLFALQQCVDGELRLIAINGINHSWKKLANYFPPEGFDRLKGVCIENGLLLTFYDQGMLCWNTETGEPVEEISNESDVIPSGVHVILIEDNRIIVKHALTYFMSMCVEDS
ncbi:unnamed protein product [Phyllotreta striolata]|uniref:Uncharacterized protein n=1 Tax=Phyllotreta striolata TaxID=444603 RepID=A0A9N9TU08_PHYSR|nr:unnamed protein product [Phyllotreta striolata]